jgi:hypothetical protein
VLCSRECEREIEGKSEREGFVRYGREHAYGDKFG